jgi:glutathione S-transferase
MRLLSGPLSLFSRKVEIALHEKGVAFEQVLVPFSQTRGYSPKHPEVLAANPKGQVPVLVTESGSIYDSTVILEYLEETHPAPALFPGEPFARAECRMLEVFADEVMLVPLRLLMHRTEPRSGNPAAWDAAEAKTALAEAAIAEQLRDLERRLNGKDYLCGAFTVADIAAFTSVLWGRRLGAPAPGSALINWYERLGRRRAFERVVAEIDTADAALSASVARKW